jgi:hypothetical protein
VSSLIEDNKAVISKICKSFFNSLKNGTKDKGIRALVVSNNPFDNVHFFLKDSGCVKALEYRGKVYIGLDIPLCPFEFTFRQARADGKEPKFAGVINSSPLYDVDKTFLPIYQLNFDMGTAKVYYYNMHTKKYVFSPGKEKIIYDITSFSWEDFYSSDIQYAVCYRFDVI